MCGTEARPPHACCASPKLGLGGDRGLPYVWNGSQPSSYLVRLLDVGRAFRRLLQVLAPSHRVLVSGRTEELVEEGSGCARKGSGGEDEELDVARTAEVARTAGVARTAETARAEN
eukprot:363680-Chlamydomonas_euryale.AAC.4